MSLQASAGIALSTAAHSIRRRRGLGCIGLSPGWMAMVGSGAGIQAGPAIIHIYEFYFTHINFTVNSGYVRTDDEPVRKGPGDAVPMAHALRSIKVRGWGA
ncbi:hypothetical protein CBM2585_B110072 [Cupriavidus taiwanensis]|nr:hypothetical protein CBM2585_B110072 [Cupriavidus taiwanensis]